MLVELAEAAPRSEVLSSLLRQVDAPAQQLLPGPYRQVEVGPGESLSLIAARELGDPLMFYALARLNAIDVPARIPVGTVLRVPASMTGENESRPAPTSGAQPEPETPVSDAEAAAEYLARDGHGRQARGMLTNILAEGGGRDSTRELLVRLSLEGAAQLSEQGDYSGAIEVLDNALTAVEAAKRRTILIEARDAIRSQSLREAALRQRKRGELIHAYQSALRSAGLAPEPNEAAALLGQIQTELVETLHNKALVAWRDRNVDLAIRTWESLLEEVPDFEPARVYLDRARRLRKRLDEP